METPPALQTSDHDDAAADLGTKADTGCALMGRARLTPEEREARRKERSRRSFSDASYAHYDPRAEGYGSAEEWISAAEAISAGCTVLKTKTGTVNPDLVTLSLEELPADIAALKRAFRNTMFIVHPDHGGTNEATRNALAAFDRLSKFYR